MEYNALQKEIYDNKIRQGFNTTDLGKEILLLAEEYGELCESHLLHDKEGSLDAVADIMVYAIGLCALFKKDADDVANRHVESPARPTFEGYIPCLGKEIGLMARKYRRSNKKAIGEIDCDEQVMGHVGNIIGYCSKLFSVMNEDEKKVLEEIVEKNSKRTGQVRI